VKDFLNATINANKEIATLIEEKRHDFLCEAISLGAGGDISKRVDLLAEDIFIKHLKQFGDIYSEECGFLEGNGKFDIIIDPIDGSNNFVSNFPYYGTSVALKEKGKYKAAVIANLANGDIFLKDEIKFQKANLKSLVFKDLEENKFSKIGIFERSYSSKKIFKILKSSNIKYRSPGAFALSLAYAKDVDFVIYEGKMRVYDVAAGFYMCEDLYVFNQEDTLLISKDKVVFDRISQLFKKGEKGV